MLLLLWLASATGPFSYIVDTPHMQLPINCVLDGQQDNFENSFRQDDIREPDIREETNLSGGGLRQLSESASSFTVKTDHRGYD